jgi:MFS family permease
MAGLGIGVELVTIGTYIAELVPKHIRGRAFACEQAVGFTAVPVAALLSYLLVPYKPLGLDGWRWVVIIGAHGALFVWFIRRALPESPRWLAQKGRLAEADRVMFGQPFYGKWFLNAEEFESGLVRPRVERDSSGFRKTPPPIAGMSPQV